MLQTNISYYIELVEIDLGFTFEYLIPRFLSPSSVAS
jgi:hypothetical protein